MKFSRKEKVSSGIPTASLPDIVFILLIFFMVTTVLRQYEGLNVILPSAKKIEKLETKRHVTYLWVGRDGTISVDDKILSVDQVSKIMYQKRKEDPQIIVSLKADKNVQMGLISDLHQQLRKADALKLNYSAKPAPI
jgi:biopolymer transport protein ExbD